MSAATEGLCKSSVLTPVPRCAVIKSKGGVMELEDLASHTSSHVEPISYSYGGKNGVTLHECPPNGQGIVALIALGIIEILEEDGVVDLKKAGHNSAIWLHTLM